MSDAVNPLLVGEILHKTVNIHDLIPHPDNYNLHPPEQLEVLKASLRRYGQVEDVIVRALPENMYQIAAHEGVTTAALQLLEAGECPHLEQWNVTIVPDSWSDLDVKGYMVTSNESTRRSLPDEELLATLLQEQHLNGFNLLSLNTDEVALNQMLESLGSTYIAAGDDEDAPEDFKGFDEGIETEFTCPKCAYRWSGKPN